MDDLLHCLERQLRALISRYETLSTTHADLAQSQTHMVREKELLMTKNKIAISQIENMVSRLKTLESAS